MDEIEGDDSEMMSIQRDHNLEMDVNIQGTLSSGSKGEGTKVTLGLRTRRKAPPQKLFKSVHPKEEKQRLPFSRYTRVFFFLLLMYVLYKYFRS